MSGNYTPSTDEVRAFYVAGIPPHRSSVSQGNAEFDRWLAERDRKMMAQGYDEGCDEAASSIFDAHECKKYNPYR